MIINQPVSRRTGSKYNHSSARMAEGLQSSALIIVPRCVLLLLSGWHDQADPGHFGVLGHPTSIDQCTHTKYTMTTSHCYTELTPHCDAVTSTTRKSPN